MKRGRARSRRRAAKPALFAVLALAGCSSLLGIEGLEFDEVACEGGVCAGAGGSTSFGGNAGEGSEAGREDGAVGGEAGESGSGGRVSTPGIVAGDPAVYRRRSTTDTLVVRGNDNHIYQIARDAPNGGWGEAVDLSVAVAGAGEEAAISLAWSDPAAFARSDGLGVVAYREDSAIRVLWETEQGWRIEPPFTEGGFAVDEPTGFEHSDAAVGIGYRTDEGLFVELRRVGAGAWESSVGGEFAAPAADKPVGYIRVDNSNVYVYRGVDDKIYEIAGELRSSLPMTPEGDVVIAVGAPFPHTRRDQKSAVVFRSNGDQVFELSFTNGGSSFPRTFNVTALSGNKSRAIDDPMAFSRSDFVNAVVYRGRAGGVEGHVYELSSPLRNPNAPDEPPPWRETNLSEAAGAPLAAGRPVGHVRGDDVDAVYYRDENDNVQELTRDGETWRARAVF